jgi:hypothetical protein
MVIDWQLTIIILLCLITGFGFAWLAVRLTQTVGNTIADAQKAGQATPAFEIVLPNGWRFNAGTPIVALYAIALVCAIGLPGWFIHETRYQPGSLITLVAPLANAPRSVRVLEGNSYFDGSLLHLFVDPYMKTADFVAFAPEYAPTSISAEFEPTSNSLTVSAAGKTLGRWNVDAANRVLLPTSISLTARAAIEKLNLETPQRQSAAGGSPAQVGVR